MLTPSQAPPSKPSIRATTIIKCTGTPASSSTRIGHHMRPSNTPLLWRQHLLRPRPLPRRSSSRWHDAVSPPLVRQRKVPSSGVGAPSHPLSSPYSLARCWCRCQPLTGMYGVCGVESSHHPNYHTKLGSPPMSWAALITLQVIRSVMEGLGPAYGDHWTSRDPYLQKTPPLSCF